MYWLYTKEHERVALLKGTSEEKIVSTLSSGDKELSFKYRKDGKHWSQIECEGYIRTPDDEYVIKDVESGTTSDTYTCTLNLEELEGKTFEDGFESVFKTFVQCMEIVLEGTGWTVAYCDVSKRRTIRKDAGADALSIISQCISTYKIEVRYDTINKTISAYEHIGSDRGRYFMESLNLRALTVGKNTYDFFTELVPIGKDGLTVESVNDGKKYISNYTYCTKRKRTTWIDRRYTDASSLLEDATYKLDEMARPYTTYEADVTDLAKQSKVYRDVLDYSLGDTLTLVSKTEQVREKQRIVKMTEYPRNPEKNTCELSSTRKTFAEIQKQETEEVTDAVSESTGVASEDAKRYADDLFETLSDDVEEVRKSTQELADKISGMNTDQQIKQINANIKSLTESVQNLTQVSSDHENRLKGTEEVIDTVKAQTETVQQMQQDVVKIRQSVISLSESVRSVKRTVETQSQQIQEIKDKINELHPETDTGENAGTEETT